jgi:high-affinity iron transporter
MKVDFRIAGWALIAGLAAACASHTPHPTADAADGGDAQRLVALVDYVAGDYGLAVHDGVVQAPSEYEEQLRFLAEAQGMARSLLPSAAADEPLMRQLAEAEARVRERADVVVVRTACHTVRDTAVARFQLQTVPSQRPSLQQAQALYTQSCAVCHGARGDAATERAAQLDPHPASFLDPARLRELSPYRVYNALTFGVPGTAMASFGALTPEERWDLAFFVFRLGHEGQPARGPVAAPLAELAGHSDRELLETLRGEQEPQPEAALAHLRHDAPFNEPPRGAGLERTRRLLRQAQAAFSRGEVREADRLVLDAYLEGFEPLEPRLRARDAGATAATETGFHELRAAVKSGDAGAVQRRSQWLQAQLLQLSEERRPVLPFAAAFLIYFREGIEAALLVGALLAGVRRCGRPEAARWIHAGWLLALPAGAVTWWVLDRLIALGADQRELVESAVALLAAGVLFSVSFWMISKTESRHWMAYLQKNLEASLSRRNLGLLAGLAFLAVYREAAETILFTQALLLEASVARLQVWAGALAGLAFVAAAAALMNRTVLRLPLAPFFGVSGALLCGLAVSFAGSGIYDLVAAGYLPPRPVSFPEIPWMGIHPDLTGLVVQFMIVLLVAGAALVGPRRHAPSEVRRRP